MFPSPHDPIAAVLALINATNPGLWVALSSENVTLGAPQLIHEPVASGVNSVLTVTAIDGQGYSKSAQVYYRRLDVGAYFSAAGITPAVDASNGIPDWATLLDALNTQYGTVFGTADLPLLAFDGSGSSIHYQAPPASWLFTGGCDITLLNPGTPLSTALTTLALPGLNPPLAQ